MPGVLGKVSFLDADKFTGWWDVNYGIQGERTATHELGHNLGLEHPPKGKNRGNVMVSGGSGNSVLWSQFETMIENYEESNKALNYGLDGLPNLGILRNKGIVSMKNTKGRNKTANKVEYLKKIMKTKK